MLDLFSKISFSQPMLLVAVLVPFVIFVTVKILSHFSTNSYCDKALIEWVIIKQNYNIVQLLYKGPLIPILCWGLFVVALAGPRINIDQRSISTSLLYNQSTAILLDLSKSMLAQDVYPNRISKAKLTIEKILIHTNYSLVSLIVFANNAHTVIPLTYDKDVILHALSALQPGMLPVEGSNIHSAINLAAEALTKDNKKTQTIIVISDGDFNVNKKNLVALRGRKITVNSIGIGTNEGQAIPKNEGGWLSFENKPVITKLNTIQLNNISSEFDGKYINETNLTAKEIKSLVPAVTGNSLSGDDNITIIWQQVYHWFLMPGLFLFFVCCVRYSTHKKKEDSTGSSNKTYTNKSNALSLLVLLTLAMPALQDTVQASQIEQAHILYQNKNYIKAEAAYKNSIGFTSQLGQANAVYKQKNYSKAVHLYTKAIQTSITNSERSTALFNLANTFYMIGDYEQAILIYQDSLLYTPKLHIAKINLEYAKLISEQVKKAIALRAGKNPASKPGSGPRMSNVEDGVVVGNSKVALSNEEDPSKQNLYTFNLPNDEINKLILRGIKHSVISTTKIENGKDDKQWEFEKTTLDMVELLVKEEKIDNYLLWKRLFEIEAGFPAPVKIPHVKPGVKPW